MGRRHGIRKSDSQRSSSLKSSNLAQKGLDEVLTVATPTLAFRVSNGQGSSCTQLRPSVLNEPMTR